MNVVLSLSLLFVMVTIPIIGTYWGRKTTVRWKKIVSISIVMLVVTLDIGMITYDQGGFVRPIIYTSLCWTLVYSLIFRVGLFELINRDKNDRLSD
jgi:hypothetical protein